MFVSQVWLASWGEITHLQHQYVSHNCTFKRTDYIICDLHRTQCMSILVAFTFVSREKHLINFKTVRSAYECFGILFILY